MQTRDTGTLSDDIYFKPSGFVAFLPSPVTPFLCIRSLR